MSKSTINIQVINRWVDILRQSTINIQVINRWVDILRQNSNVIRVYRGSSKWQQDCVIFSIFRFYYLCSIYSLKK